MNAPKKIKIACDQNSISERLLTVDDFKAWLRVNESAREELEVEITRRAVDSAVRFVTREMANGFSLQDAGNKFMRISKANRLPSAHTNAARAALQEMGWTAKK